MELIRILASRLKALFGGRRLDAELDDEVRAHIAMAVEENVARGMSAEEARTAALRAFGGVTQVKEQYRTRRVVPLLEQAVWGAATAQGARIYGDGDSDAGAGHRRGDISVQRGGYGAAEADCFP